MNEEAYVLRQEQDGVVTLTLNRPKSRNALSQGMIDALRSEFHELASNQEVRVVILAGAGPAFCAGHDLKEMRGACYGRDYTEKLFSDCAELMKSIVRLPKPVIARVHGIATAAGAQLVASADLAIAATDSHFATPGVNIGLFCSTPMVALSRNLSNKQAMQMLMLGELIDADTALRFGLVNEIVAPEMLEASALDMARKIADKSPLTVAIGKAAFYRQSEMTLDQAYTYTADIMVKNLEARDAQEGIDAFVDKRQPIWCGR